MKFYVYMIFDVTGKPRYVGKGSGKRWQTHLTGSHNKQLKGMLLKAVDEMPIVIVRENMVEEDAFQLECLLISTLGRKDRRKGPLLNHTDGGDGPAGYKHTKATRRKLSDMQKGVERGPRPKWHGERISEGRKGQTPTEEARRNMSEAAKKRIERQGMAHVWGKQHPHTDETKLKMSLTRKGRKKTPEWIEKVAAAQRGKPRGPMSEEQKNKIRLALKGKPWTAKRRAAELVQ